MGHERQEADEQKRNGAMSHRRRAGLRLFLASLMTVLGISVAACGQALELRALIYPGLAVALIGALYFAMLKAREWLKGQTFRH